MSIQNEKQTLRKMIALYCAKKHRSGLLCEACFELLDYAEEKITKCPYKENKPSCRKCPIHCFSHRMRKRITEVMRYSGPRMIIHQPIMAIRHKLHDIQSKKNLEKD
ncbi:nitrous oxide-stimulated promoter family protein [Bacteroidota bacterium]